MPTIGLHDTVTVTCTDTDGVEVVDIVVQMDTLREEVAYRSTSSGESGGAGAFGGQFTSTSRVAVTDGFAYAFKRSGGWRRGTMTVRTTVVDVAGELTITSTTYTVTDPAELAVLDFVGITGTDPAVNKFTPITFTVRGAAHVLVALRFTARDERILVYDDGFQFGWAASSATVADVDLDFSLLPVGGWPDDIACLSIIAVDDMGGAINFGDEP